MDRISGYFFGGDLQLDYGRLILGWNGVQNFIINTNFLNDPNPSTTLWICPQKTDGSSNTANGISLLTTGEFRVHNKLIAQNAIVNDKLLIGTNTFPVDIDGNGKLAVKGKIYAQEVEVEINNWPDYVFQKDYNLMPLERLEKFILQNNHLPDVPKESDVMKNGSNLGETDAILLRKIEELTLYIIEQNKQIKTLKDQIENINK